MGDLLLGSRSRPAWIDDRTCRGGRGWPMTVVDADRARAGLRREVLALCAAASDPARPAGALAGVTLGMAGPVGAYAGWLARPEAELR